eukprot:TRINITY_DN2381_c0_g1_i1.p1 TRINITY_DN2381_c0_g1~~TRINITY_DN2381_c0_g1_i1.p1  ORF type:complete len:373 (+),score=60.92 TRINITY_DN2381_c0_g1_i1:82-1200(+)
MGEEAGDRKCTCGSDMVAFVLDENQQRLSGVKQEPHSNRPVPTRVALPQPARVAPAAGSMSGRSTFAPIQSQPTQPRHTTPPPIPPAPQHQRTALSAPAPVRQAASQSLQQKGGAPVALPTPLRSTAPRAVTQQQEQQQQQQQEQQQQQQRDDDEYVPQPKPAQKPAATEDDRDNDDYIPERLDGETRKRKRGYEGSGMPEETGGAETGGQLAPPLELLRQQLRSANRLADAYLYQAALTGAPDDVAALRKETTRLGLRPVAYTAEGEGWTLDFDSDAALTAFVTAPDLPPGWVAQRSWRCTNNPHMRFELDSRNAFLVDGPSICKATRAESVDVEGGILRYRTPTDATLACMEHNNVLVKGVSRIKMRSLA